MGQAFIAVFQIITNDSWSVVLYNLQRWYSIPVVPAFYCLILIFMGTFFLLNLMLAVVMESYMESEILTAREIKETLDEEKTAFDERIKGFSSLKKGKPNNKLAPQPTQTGINALKVTNVARKSFRSERSEESPSKSKKIDPGKED
jgi:hypothetical protein